MYSEYKKIMGPDFIGPDQLKKISSKMGISSKYFDQKFPVVPLSLKQCAALKHKFILILGISNCVTGNLNLLSLRARFGCDSKKEPCFYNQDWYLNEKFASKTLKNKWYLVSKAVLPESRGRVPIEIKKETASVKTPPAILAAYTFFSYFLLNKKILWKHDFIWCSDQDHNKDRIYVGRYVDPDGINQNGFNIHRHLAIRSCYGVAPAKII